ncbi:MAG: hypothetical protein ABIF01_02710 [Candidatus Micrarchaeota archaeon]
MGPVTKTIISAGAGVGLFPVKRFDVLADAVRTKQMGPSELTNAQKQGTGLKDEASRLSRSGQYKKAEKLATTAVSVFEALAIRQPSPSNISEHARALEAQARIMAQRANSLKEADRFAILRTVQAIYGAAGSTYTEAAGLFKKNGEHSKARDAFRDASSAFNNQSGTLQSIYLFPQSLAAAAKATDAQEMSRQ